MNKSIIIFTCFVFVLIRNTANAQDVLKMEEDKESRRDTRTFTIRSIDGKNQKVYIIPGYARHNLRISCLKDTISIDDFWSVPPETRILNGSFIEIKYEVRGGSNLGLSNIMLLCVSNNKLYESMHVLRYINSETGNELSRYNINVALNGRDKRHYKLNVTIDDEVNSKSNPEANYNYHNRTVLNFDISRNVFYNIKEDIYDSFIYDYLKNKKLKLQIKGNFPVIILGKETYYSIKNKWYVSDRNKELYLFK